jgi:TolA-binding protein
MKRLIALFVLLGVVLATPVYAAGVTAEPSLWERLRKKIETMAPKKKLSTTTAAGGVRGSLADADDVYWKGESKLEQIDSDELNAFKKAIALVDSGKVADAQAAFSDFIKNHPESNLRADAEAALAQLQTAK